MTTSMTWLKTASQIVASKSFLGKQDESIFPESAVRLRDELLQEVDNIEQVVGADSQQLATDALGKINRVLGQAEKERKEVKAPFIAIGKKIEADVNKFSVPLLEHKLRIQSLLADYQRKLIEAARKQEEEQRKEAQRLEEEKRRIAAEADEKAKAAVLAGNTASAEAVQEAAQMKMAAVNQQMAEVLKPVEVQKAEGMGVRRPWKFKVIDAAKAYAARPDLFTIEPKTAVINAELKDKEGKVEIPGLEIYQDINIIA